MVAECLVRRRVDEDDFLEVRYTCTTSSTVILSLHVFTSSVTYHFLGKLHVKNPFDIHNCCDSLVSFLLDNKSIIRVHLVPGSNIQG